MVAPAWSSLEFYRSSRDDTSPAPRDVLACVCVLGVSGRRVLRLASSTAAQLCLKTAYLEYSVAATAPRIIRFCSGVP